MCVCVCVSVSVFCVFFMPVRPESCSESRRNLQVQRHILTWLYTFASFPMMKSVLPSPYPKKSAISLLLKVLMLVTLPAEIKGVK